jgi:hypothetical protein
MGAKKGSMNFNGIARTKNLCDCAQQQAGGTEVFYFKND